ncbi:MAG: LuxR C-terminal-related transcriptional regulator [Deinococcales bacterium]
MGVDAQGLRVLVFAPLGRDADLLCAALARAGMQAVTCKDPSDLRRRLGEGSGAAVLTAEALSPKALDIVRMAYQTQPAWSDLSFVVLVDPPWRDPGALESGSNTTVLFRPVHPSSLVTVVRASLRARQRQYQVRDLLREEERVNQELASRVAERTAELRASNDAVEAERRHAEAILQSISDGFAVIDRQDRLTYLNPRGAELLERLTGMAAPELIGGSVWQIFSGAGGSVAGRRYREAAASSGPVTLETYVPALGVWLQLRSYPSAEGLTIYAADVTERKTTEEELMRAVQEVMTDTAWFSRSLLEKIAQIRSRAGGANGNDTAVAELTNRERQVLERMASGRDNRSIAGELGIKEQTVRNYITKIYEKLGLHSRADAIVWARERGLVGS